MWGIGEFSQHFPLGDQTNVSLFQTNPPEGLMLELYDITVLQRAKIAELDCVPGKAVDQGKKWAVIPTTISGTLFCKGQGCPGPSLSLLQLVL